jgi:transcriptional regulator of nitric oxide reductase
VMYIHGVPSSTFRNALHTAFLLSIILAIMAGSLHGQTGNAVVSGQVKDQTGGVIPGATVTVTNIDTNVSRTATSNAEGLYVLTDLIPGRYSLSAKFSGFKNLDRGEFTLRVGDHAVIDLQMEVGSQSERVTITSLGDPAATHFRCRIRTRD